MMPTCFQHKCFITSVIVNKAGLTLLLKVLFCFLNISKIFVSGYILYPPFVYSFHDRIIRLNLAILDEALESKSMNLHASSVISVLFGTKAETAIGETVFWKMSLFLKRSNNGNRTEIKI